MKIQYLLVCEFARPGARGLSDYLGVLDRIYVTRLPASHPSLAVVALAVAENEDDLGEQPVHLTALQPGGQPLFEQRGTVRFQALGGAWLSGARLVVELRNLTLSEFGRYRFHLRIGRAEADHPLDVVEGPPPS